MAKPIVFVFARAPVYGAVKTRLARDIGCMEALRFYRHSLLSMCRRLARDTRFEVRLATTPLAALHEAGFWPPGLQRVDQGKGDLGQRMIKVLQSAGCGPAIVIGSDIPEAGPTHVAEAFRILAGASCVLGPATDGGYWLIGAQHPNRLRRDGLAGVRWSTAHTLQDTYARLGKVALLNRTLNDVDDAVSLELVRRKTQPDRS